jgi:hypothetical protein
MNKIITSLRVLYVHRHTYIHYLRKEPVQLMLIFFINGKISNSSYFLENFLIVMKVQSMIDSWWESLGCANMVGKLASKQSKWMYMWCIKMCCRYYCDSMKFYVQMQTWDKFREGFLMSSWNSILYGWILNKNIGSHELDLRMPSVKRLSCQVCCCASCTHTYWLLSKNYNLINFIIKLGLFLKE